MFDPDAVGCTREFIEGVFRPNQRNMLIRLYCSDNFEFLNLVDSYYRKMDSNAIVLFIFIVVAFPALFIGIGAIADKYLSVGMRDLSKRFKLSPTLAAVTLIAFANGAPDVLASLSNAGKESGAYISIGALLGAFIFSSTLALANVSFNIPSPIQLPKRTLMKELVFYLLLIVVICVFGLMQTSGYPLVTVYLSVYAVYIAITLVFDRIQRKEEEERKRAELDDKEYHDNVQKQSRQFNQQFQVQEDDAKPTPKDAKTDDADSKEEAKPTDEAFYKSLVNEVVDEEAGLFKHLVTVPLFFAGLFTVPYLESPLQIFPLKMIVVAMSIPFSLFILQLTGLPLTVLIAVGVIVASAFLVLELLHFKQYALDTCYEVVAVVAAIAWIKIFATLIIDFISFLAFYFNINEIILASLLLSAGNSVGDFFGNAALAKQGEAVMGALACYAGQNFNNFIGFSMNTLVSAIAGKTGFDIFAMQEQNKDNGSMPIGNKFVIGVILFASSILVLNMIYYSSNKYLLSRAYGVVMVCVYSAFFVVSLVLGFLSMG